MAERERWFNLDLDDPVFSRSEPAGVIELQRRRGDCCGCCAGYDGRCGGPNATASAILAALVLATAVSAIALLLVLVLSLDFDAGVEVGSGAVGSGDV